MAGLESHWRTPQDGVRAGRTLGDGVRPPGVTGAALREDRDHWEMRGPGHRAGIGPPCPPPQRIAGALEEPVFLASCVLDLMDFNINTADITGFCVYYVKSMADYLGYSWCDLHLPS